MRDERGNRVGPPSAGAPATATDELRPVTSLFADVVGSTSLGERLTLAEVKAVIGECVSRMCEVVEAFGGRVGAYMGDGIAAFFGLDATREDDIERGARAALGIRSIVSQYSVEVLDAWSVSDFDVRIALNTGRVAIGRVGAADPQLVALGDTVNVAARLQAAASPGTILIGPGVAQRLGDRFLVKGLGDVHVRGRREPVLAFELVSERNAKPPTAQRPFVGRNPELAVLSSMVRELEAGRGQLCVIHGDAGIGKSRLLSELRRRIPSDVVWLEGTCDPIDSRLPYAPFVEALRSWLGVDDRTAAIETRIKLASRAADLSEHNAEDRLAYLSRLLGVELSAKLARRLEGLPPDVLSAGLTNAYRDWLISVAHVSPCVLALDNFGLAASSTVEMGTALFEAVQHAPILMVVTIRPDSTDASRRLRLRALDELAHRYKDLPLTPLTRGESEVLVAELDKDCLLETRLRDIVVERSEGNPLYIEELFAAVASAPSLSPEPDLPAGLETLLLARIDSLTAEAKSTLHAAAILGRSFPYEVLAAMQPARDLDDALSELLRADIIREHSRRPRGFMIRHGLIREAALSTLTPARFQALSASAARALRGWAEFDEERDAEPLARHHLACGEGAEAAACLESLAERLAAVYRYDEASDVLGRCLTELRLTNQGPALRRICRKRAELLALRGQVDLAVELINEAMESATALTERLELMLAKARWLGDAGRFTEADRFIDECLGRTLPRDVFHAEALVLQGRLALHRQDKERAVAAVDQIGDPSLLPERVRFDAHLLLTAVFAGRGDVYSAKNWAIRAHDIADGLGRTTSQLTARRVLGLMHALTGELDEGGRLLRNVYERYKEIGAIAGQFEAALNLLYVQCVSGALLDAAELGDDVMRLEPGPMWTGLLSANLAEIRLELGELAEAESLAQTTLALNQDRGGWPRTTARAVISLCAERRGDRAVADRHLKAAEQEARAAGHKREEASVEVALARSARARGESRRALEHAESARRFVSGGMEVSLTLMVERVYGTMLVENRDHRAQQVLSGVLNEARRTGMRLEEGRALVALSCIDPENSTALRREAGLLFEECGSQLGLAELKEAEVRTLESASDAPR